MPATKWRPIRSETQSINSRISAAAFPPGSCSSAVSDASFAADYGQNLRAFRSRTGIFPTVIKITCDLDNNSVSSRSRLVYQRADCGYELLRAVNRGGGLFLRDVRAGAGFVVGNRLELVGAPEKGAQPVVKARLVFG
jgi:hypothetical protein